MNDLNECLVLLVDDVKENINVLVEALKNDYRLGFALDGESALKFTRARLPDLILLDIMMPGMDGYEVCRRLKADPVTSSIPVVFLTALDEVRNKAAAFETGAVDYITKPFEILEVKARVKTHLMLKLAHQLLESQRDQMKHSLDLAQEVQQGLIPKSDPKVDGLDVSGRIIYCDETGGDYYDYLFLGEKEPGKIAVVVGDVSDHGIQSALLMTTARAFLRQRASMPGGIDRIIADVNQQFSRDVEDSGRFMTLFFCEIDSGRGLMRWVRAGHDPGLVYDPAAGSFEELAGYGLPLGVSADGRYEERQREIKSGEIIVIGTDGIWETRNHQGEQFGKERFRQIIQNRAAGSAREITEAVISEVERFRPALPKEDDITLVVVKVEGVRP